MHFTNTSYDHLSNMKYYNLFSKACVHQSTKIIISTTTNEGSKGMRK